METLTMKERIRKEGIPFDLYPCGSRYFGHAGPGSDEDYFVSMENMDIPWLEENGWKHKESSEYSDRFLRAVWEKDNIDLIFVADLTLHLEARIALTEWDNLYNFGKSERAAIWNLLKIALS